MTVPPGSTIGIVGGGQLGRMLAMAAAQLGYKCHIYAPEEMPPAAEVSALFTRGAYDDEAALARFGASVDVATYEFENIAAAPLAALAAQAPLYPPRAALETAQDRLSEKAFVLEMGGRPAPFVAVDDEASLSAALAKVGAPAILKTRRFGYDGKGQVRIISVGDAGAAWQAVRGAPAVLEVHNSGHWTIEGAFTSQFENHIRAICSLPLGATDLVAREVQMRNLIGRDAHDWAEILADRCSHLHLYGKGDARPGRKMGHVTRLIGVAGS
jgi:phosphoribosylaminoimidazole carboxylase (NCAIR synthetase)